ncbi:MAG: radical SAM protein [Desulfobacteraceae bacterium]|nr:radical SAM protein [Desulfobacteraceae bacterium]
MRILLVQLPTSHLGAGEKVYPLGLARLSGIVPLQTDKTTLDMNLSPDPWLALKQRLEQMQPQVTALSFRNLDPLAGHQGSYLTSFVTAVRLVRLICPKCRIIAGGPAFSLFARELMQVCPQVDFGLVGEAEEVFAGLIDANGPSLSTPGLVWRDNGQLRFNAPEYKPALDKLPVPDIKSFNPRTYLEHNRYVAAIGIEGKRGCDLQCGYCVYPQIGGARTRLRPPVSIIDEIEFFHHETGAELFHFTDGVVNRPADHFEAVCLELKRRKLKVQWSGFFREDTLSARQLDLARKTGLSAVYLSGDALSGKGLKVLNKRLIRDDLFRAARLLAQSGLLTVCHFLVNLPGETEDDALQAQQTLEAILELHAPAGNLGAVIFNTVRLYPGAPLTRRLIRQKMIPSDINLLYPVYFDPPEGAHRRHELETLCHAATTFAYLDLRLSSENSR